MTGLGSMWHGAARLEMLDWTWLGSAKPGVARLIMLGKARLGLARPGEAWQGLKYSACQIMTGRNMAWRNVA